MISVRTVNGVQTITLDEGDWQFRRIGWAPWTATHVPTDTVIPTGTTDVNEARLVARAQILDQPPAAAEAVRYTVESRFNRRFGPHRQGEPR
ncbi:MAG TPA: hypothetical protein VGW74_04700 [Propionibacteriaceae bacterium]|nr:hypothetical protein [Propionibacteriaceae bacterium]